MAIALVGTPTTAAGSTVTSTTVAITVPSGSVGDLLVFSVSSGSIVTSNVPAPYLTGPAGLTRLDDVYCIYVATGVWYRFVQAGDASSYTFTIAPTGAPLAAVCARYSGVSAIRFWADYGHIGANTQTGSSVTMPTGENVEANDLVLSAIAMGASSSSTSNVSALSTPASWTNVVNKLGATSGVTSAYHTTTAIYSRTGASDTPSVTGSTGQWSAIRMVLSPTSTPVPDTTGDTIVYINSTSAVGSSTGVAGSVTRTISVPSGVTDGMLLLLVAFSSGPGSFTDPAGWTPLGVAKDAYAIGSTNVIIDGISRVYYRIASSEPASYNVICSLATANNQFMVAMVAYSGVRSPMPISMAGRMQQESSATSGIASTTSIAPYTLPNVQSFHQIVNVYLAGGDTTGTYTLTIPTTSGWTSRLNAKSAVVSDFNAATGVSDKLGATDLPTASASKASGWMTWSIALAPAPPYSVDVSASSTSGSTVSATAVGPGAVTAATTAASTVSGGLACDVSRSSSPSTTVTALAVGPAQGTPPTTASSTVTSSRTDVCGVSAPLTSASSVAALAVGPAQLTSATTAVPDVQGVVVELGNVSVSLTVGLSPNAAAVGPGTVTVATTAGADLVTTRTDTCDVTADIPVDPDVEALTVGPGVVDVASSPAMVLVSLRTDAAVVSTQVSADPILVSLRTDYASLTAAVSPALTTVVVLTGPATLSASTSAGPDVDAVAVGPANLSQTVTAAPAVFGTISEPPIVDAVETASSTVLALAINLGAVITTTTAAPDVEAFRADVAAGDISGLFSVNVEAVAIGPADVDTTVQPASEVRVVRTEQNSVNLLLTVAATVDTAAPVPTVNVVPIQDLGTAVEKTVSDTLVLSVDSKTVTLGNDIFVMFVCNTPNSGPVSATDNLGNTYALISDADGVPSGLLLHTALLKGHVGTAGVLTDITITGPVSTARVASAEEIQGVGALINTGQWVSPGSGIALNAYPGTSVVNIRPEVPGNVWVGAFGWRNTVGTLTVPAPSTQGVAAVKAGTEVGTSGAPAASNASGCLVFFVCDTSDDTMLNAQTGGPVAFATAGAEYASNVYPLDVDLSTELDLFIDSLVSGPGEVSVEVGVDTSDIEALTVGPAEVLA